MIWTQLHHHNILPLLGICVDLFDARPAMVTPWMVHGNTLNYLSKNSSVDKLSLVWPYCTIRYVFSSPDFLSQMAGIANGLSYLHNMQPTVVHGDLRCVRKDHEQCII